MHGPTSATISHRSEIYVVDAVGGRPRRVTASPPDSPGDFGLCGRLTGSASRSSASPPKESHVYLVSRDGSGLRRFTRTGDVVPFSVAWSPEGRTIAFSREVAAHDFEVDLYVVGVDGRGLRRLTTPRFDEDGPVWAPQ